MKFGCQQFCSHSNQWKSWYTARILCFKKNFKRDCAISTGTSYRIPNLGVQCIKLEHRSRLKKSDSTQKPPAACDYATLVGRLTMRRNIKTAFTLGRNWAQFFVCFIVSEFIRLAKTVLQHALPSENRVTPRLH